MMYHLLLNSSLERRRVIKGLRGSKYLTPIFNKETGRESGNYTKVGLISVVSKSLQRLIKDEVIQQLEKFELQTSLDGFF